MALADPDSITVLGHIFRVSGSSWYIGNRRSYSLFILLGIGNFKRNTMTYANCRIVTLSVLFITMGAIGIPGLAQTPESAKSSIEIPEFDHYGTPQELNAMIRALNQARPDLTAIHKIGQSSGGRELLVLEIKSNIDDKAQQIPAVFVVGNLEGTVPIASQAAIFLIYQLINREAARKDLAWYILVNGNPDGAAHFFTKPIIAGGWNESAHNDDMDDAIDEDGPDDLDGNGIITQMRVEDPGGNWIPSEDDLRLMRLADPVKGEKGIFKLYTEGIDQDGDGQYNEDGPGGTDISITFPHLFKPFTEKGGDWPGSEPETFAIMKFVMDHPEIAMTVTLGATNMCLQPPAGGRKGEVDLNKIKVPERYARSFGIDPEATYTLREVMDILRPMMPPGTEITEAMISSMLGLGAVVNPLEEDLKFYREFSERYKDFLKQKNLDGKRLKPPQPKDASFELWSYYHLGVPTFSMDFWTLPEAEEEKADNIGNDRKAKMPPDQNEDAAKRIPEAKESAEGDPKIKALLSFSDSVLQGKGFVEWTPFKHPTLGDVEIGGAVPYVDNTPPPGMAMKLIEGQVPWIFDLAARLPRVKIAKTETAMKGAAVYELTVWVQNAGELPLPTAMGKRNRHVGPIVITLEGRDLVFISGREHTAINGIDAMKNRKLTWLLRSEKSQTLRLKLESANAWSDSVEIPLGGAQ